MGSGCSADRGSEAEWCRPRAAAPGRRSSSGSSRKRRKRKVEEEERRKHLLQALSAEAQTKELLTRIPGRICNNGSTRSACAFTQQGSKGINQDAMLVWDQFASRKDTLLCCVFDGHGPYGHLVANKVRDTLPTKLMSMWKAHMRGDVDLNESAYDGDDHSSCEDDDCSESDRNGTDVSGFVGGNGFHALDHHRHAEDAWHGSNSLEGAQNGEQQVRPTLAMEVWRECIVRTFRLMDRELRLQPTIDCFCSGTTAIILLQQGMELILGNVGDSRAVLATFVHGGDLHIHNNARLGKRIKEPKIKLQAIQLTVDLKPNLPREAERIRRCKGRVFAMDDEPEIARVWLPWDDAPGLAMARAFGDFCLKEFGLISVPDITHRVITSADQFVILATDGIWDVLSNKQAINVVASAPSRVTAARLLVETAIQAWKRKHPSSKVDDCAAICLFFHNEPGTTVRRGAINATSMHYYTEEDEEENDGDSEYGEDGNEIISGDEGRRSQVPWYVPIHELSLSHHAEPEEINWKGHNDALHAIDANNSENDGPYPVYFVDDTPYPDYFVDVDEGRPPLVSEIHEVDVGVEDNVNSPPRRSLAEYMMSKDNDEEEEDKEWSALVGEVRVNSILNLPRFKVGDAPSMRRP